MKKHFFVVAAVIIGSQLNAQDTTKTSLDEVVLTANKYPNKNDQMKNDLELYPFLKQNPRKTIITPIIEKRLAEKIEQERLSQEQ